MDLNRRDFLFATSSLLCFPLCAYGDNLPVSGREVPAFREVDSVMLACLKETEIPGGACAIVRGGKLLFARGYGYANREAAEPFLPSTVCRIGSVSKTVTAVAILKLVEAGRLSLDDPASKIGRIKPFEIPGSSMDPRVYRITVRNLLQHRTGIPENSCWSTPARARTMGVAGPLSRNQLVDLALGQPLKFDPGVQYMYENTNFMILARILEEVTGKKYEAWVHENVFAPIGVTDAFCIRTRNYQRKPNEAVYYDLPDRKEPSVFPEDKGKMLPKSYGGGIYYEAVDGAGGWVCSAIDLARFVVGLEGSRGIPLLNQSLLRAMTARPKGEQGDNWYGLGIQLTTEGHADGQFIFNHNGAVSGARSFMNNRFDGSTFLVVFNGDNAAGNLGNTVVQPLHDAINRVAVAGAWPTQDQFPR